MTVTLERVGIVPDATDIRLARMFLESTGTHMLDSGMAYGRAWQRERLRFGLPTDERITDDETIRTVAETLANDGDTFGRYGMELSTFGYLRDRLTYVPEADALWQRYLRLYDAKTDGRESDLSVMEAFTDALAAHVPVKGVYGNDSGAFTENSYNDTDTYGALDRVLQWRQWETDDWYGPFGPGDGWILLQLHGGADVRGGYTRPVLFQARESEGLLDGPSYGVSCDRCESGWDNGYDRYRLTTDAGTELVMIGPYDRERMADIHGPDVIRWDDESETWIHDTDDGTVS